MARRTQDDLIEWILRALRIREMRILLLAGLLLAVGIWIVVGCPGLFPPPGEAPLNLPAPPPGESLPRSDPQPAPGPGRYQLCFWNVENLFDDQNDHRTGPGDSELDPWYADSPRTLEAKLDHLCDVLLATNGGRGPDILCLAEVESHRAAELLQQALNRQIEDTSRRYRHVLFESPGGGRTIGTAILTRLAVDPNATRLLGNRLRILQGRIVVAGQPLTLVASHWSSRISDKTGAARGRYGEVIYANFQKAYEANPSVDYLVCGDFNDNPEDASVVERLRAVADLSKDRSPGPRLLNLMTPLGAEGKATHFYGSKAYLFDQICVSPGLLDKKGWWCLPQTTQVIPRLAGRTGKPNRFGGPSDRRPLTSRGASDHFPVTVDLEVR
ncbi:MAG: endonuclease/exonuclease/phosphatase family protein [Gemmataceae bacterium]